MPISRRALFGLAAVPAFGQSRWQQQPATKAAYTEADITPEIGMEQPGGYGKVFHKTLHDPCRARIALFDDNTTRVVVIGLDALIVPRPWVLAVRDAIQARTGISAGNILLNASHSHSSGPFGMVQPGEYDSASPLVRQLAYEKSSAADPRYLKMAADRVVEAVVKANQNRADLLSGAGAGHEEKVGYNRRIRMANGRTFSHPGVGNPDSLQYAGPIDPQVGVIGSWTRDGKLAGCIVNYACHATTNPGGISANWIYYLEKTIRGFFGPQVTVVFLQGACGDVTQVDNLTPHQAAGGEEAAEIVGGRVGAEAVKVLLSMARGALTPVASRSEVLRIPRRKPSKERLQQALDQVRQGPEKAGSVEWTFAKETLMLDHLIRVSPIVDAEVQVIQIGPAAIVSNPAEYFVEFGLDIKAKSRFPLTFPAELSNGCVGYVPTEEALSASGGGYETRLTSYSNLIPTAGRLMANTGIALANQLTPGPLPAPPKAKPFSAPWGYGNVPPEV